MTDSSRTIAATGTGLAEAVPDLLTLSVGVECRREQVAAAYSEAGRLSSAISAVLRQHGITDADIRTSGLNVRADILWQEGRGQTVAGYIASSLLTVRLPRPARSLKPPLQREAMMSASMAWNWDSRTRPRLSRGRGERPGPMPWQLQSTTPPSPGQNSAAWFRYRRNPARARRSRWQECSASKRRTASPWKPENPVSRPRSA